MEAAKETAQTAIESVAKPVSEATAKVTESLGLSSVTSNTNIALVFFGYLVVALIVFVLAYVLYSYLAKKIVQSETYLLPETKVPILGTEFTKASGKGIPASGNGKRQTIAFWIYINDVDKYKGLYRHIWHRGEKQAIGASPLIFMDKASNKIHIRYDDLTSPAQISMSAPYVDTRDITVPPATASTKYTVNKDSDKIPYDLATHGITIDYVPIQRWVHVAVVVNEEVNGGSIQAFLDGELVKSVEAGKTINVEFIAGSARQTVTQEYKFQNLNLDKPGDVYIGGSLLESVGPGFAGLVSKITFINHDLNVKDIYNLYLQGPIDNLASKLGMPAYGVRSPIYKIGS
jgi:phage baseplate assembly protein gpV